jgi:microcystin-dependent protein
MADPLILNPTLTLAGQAAAFNASNTGIELIIDGVTFGRAHYDPTGNELALVDPVGSRIPFAGGSRPTPYQLRISSAWKENVGEVPIGEIGFWAGDVLVFVWSKANGQVASYKTDGVTYVLMADLAFAQVPANSITIVISPDESAALAALSAHEGAANAHPQYLLRKDVAKDAGPLMGLVHSAGSTANALLLALDAPESILPAYAKFQRFQFVATATNVAGGVTANVEGLGAITVKRGGDAGLVDLEPGDIKAGSLYDLNYDGTYFQLGGGVGSGKAFERYSFTAAVAQSEFTAAHVPGSVIVLRNGREVFDFTSAADGSKITLAIACNMDDRIEILAFKSFRVADTFTKAEIMALLATAGAVPVGTMLPFPVDIVPPGFLEVDASVKSIAVYPDLAAFLGTRFNQGNEGAGNFRLPESRAEFFRGWDHGRGVDAGRAIGSWQKGTMVIADTTGNADGTVVAGLGTATATPLATFGIDAVTLADYPNQFTVLGSAANAATSTGFVGSTRPRNLAVMWCIKAWNAPVNQGNIDIAALAALAAQATEINQGTAKVATDAQMLDGANDVVVATPKKLRKGFAISLTANGYITFPSWLGGLIVQWGTGLYVADTPVTFPIAFPNACLSLVACGTNYDAPKPAYQKVVPVSAYSQTKTGFLASSTNGIAANGSWLAIGN